MRGGGMGRLAGKPASVASRGTGRQVQASARHGTCEARHSRFRNTFSVTSQRGRRRRQRGEEPLPPTTPCSWRRSPATAGSCIHFSSLRGQGRAGQGGRAVCVGG